ncbi:uncharacterized protein PADG_04339 [Paracoccidioides brasiliensis Pb18]|uniref:Uncharacterized protein n=1 Tax=Paracoccidioides brasiliensis (strain Pb18) TaxID=502780 RepID=C1GAQ3_PARBD|nr:uncharacterized protein PADG_04339 [Paracoccidioides brasiliensis Pb18]EEH48255.2 hypothetical protein PADG_04339 [Paracoccidioides brasiliensis Pb18]
MEQNPSQGHLTSSASYIPGGKMQNPAENWMQRQCIIIECATAWPLSTAPNAASEWASNPKSHQPAHHGAAHPAA